MSDIHTVQTTHENGQNGEAKTQMSPHLGSKRKGIIEENGNYIPQVKKSRLVPEGGETTEPRQQQHSTDDQAPADGSEDAIEHTAKSKREHSSGTMSWGYDASNGPATWAQNFPAAAGQRQSPVDLSTSGAEFDPSLGALSVTYETEKNLELENPGLSFKANISGNSVLTGGPLGKTKYKLVQFHFHWGHDDASGSEHTVNGKMYPSELHLVHYNADKYASFGEAVTESDGLAVLGVFLKVGAADHPAFKSLSDNASKVKCGGSKCASGCSFDPSSLLPGDLTEYWTYEGSLTTPPCCESVQWIVLKNEISVSPSQITNIRALCCDDCGSKPIPANYRPPLALGNRKLRASFKGGN